MPRCESRWRPPSSRSRSDGPPAGTDTMVTMAISARPSHRPPCTWYPRTTSGGWTPNPSEPQHLRKGDSSRPWGFLFRLWGFYPGYYVGRLAAGEQCDLDDRPTNKRLDNKQTTDKGRVVSYRSGRQRSSWWFRGTRALGNNDSPHTHYPNTASSSQRLVHVFTLGSSSSENL
jgi:hypothetical protein